MQDSARAVRHRLPRPWQRYGTTVIVVDASVLTTALADDAAHVALAELLDVRLLTGDQRLARAAGPRCAVELFGTG